MSHADYDAGENGGAMTDSDYYDAIAEGEREDGAAAPGQALGTLAFRWHSEIRESEAHEMGGELGLMRDAVVGQKLTCLRELQRAIDEDIAAAAAAQPAPGDALAKLRAAIEAHEPAHGMTQWYVDECGIDCDTNEFWAVIAAALAAAPAAPAAAPELAAAPDLRTAWRLADERRAKLSAVRQAAEEMHAEAQLIAPASNGPDDIPDVADQVRAVVLHETAGRILAALEEP